MVSYRWGKWKTFTEFSVISVHVGLSAWLARYCACFDPFLIVCFSLLDILMNSIRWARRPCHLSCSSLPSNTSRVSRACWSRTTDMPFLSVSRLPSARGDARQGNKVTICTFVFRYRWKRSTECHSFGNVYGRLRFIPDWNHTKLHQEWMERRCQKGIL